MAPLARMTLFLARCGTPLHGAVRLLAAAALAGLLLGSTACTPLPSLDNRTVSTALAASQVRETPLGRAVAKMAADHPGTSGIHALADPHEAFVARVLLAGSAKRTLDVQYYIWHQDMTGTLLFDVLRETADRGVRVRLLLDDNNTGSLDEVLAALDAHPNIEVRLFNPFVPRSPRWWSYVTDFSRVNRRMHNKSFTADNAATIIGGRNIGDEYFGATYDVLFSDLDALAVGPVVKEVSEDFDRYWSSGSAYPVSRLLPAAPPDALQNLQSRAEDVKHLPGAARYVKLLKETNLMARLNDGSLPLQWATTHMVSDDPAKGLGKVGPKQLLTYELNRIIGEPKSTVDLVSAYFVPTATGVRAFTDMATRGVDVRILTNSLEATDVAAVHAGYAKRRKPLLQAGIKLYELKKVSDSGGGSGSGVFGSSGSSLHAKTFGVDGERVFIGSFNFDPRSAKLNTELGFIIDSPVLARDIEDAFNDRVPKIAYEVRLDKDGTIYWLERREDGSSIRYDTEPGASVWRRSMVEVLSVLPIEWLL